MKILLVPLDQSRRDGIALGYAREMAQSLGASITLVQVVPVIRTLIGGVVRQAEAHVDAVRASLAEQGIAADSIVRRGDPASVIYTLAQELSVHMIVMVTRSRSSLGKMVLGSVADKVLSNCRRPVLLLSETASQEQPNEEGFEQAVYIGTLIWSREQRGLYTPEEARAELTRVAARGLEHDILYSAYETARERGASALWLDPDFQKRALQEFLPGTPEGEAHPIRLARRRAA